MGCSKSSSMRKFIAIQSYLKKQEKHQIDNLKQLEKEQKLLKISRRKEIIKIRAEIKEKEMKETIVKIQFSSVQSFSRVLLLATPLTAACQISLSITNSRSLPKLMSIASVMQTNHLILCCLLLLPPSIFPSIGVFSNESILHIRWPKYWSLSFNISPSNEHSALISFRMDLLDLLAVQKTLKSLLRHHSSKASVLWCSAFFIV